jgi:hypothetical protein
MRRVDAHNTIFYLVLLGFVHLLLHIVQLINYLMVLLIFILQWDVSIRRSTFSVKFPGD